MKNMFLRFKFDGATVFEIDPSSIRGFRIGEHESADGGYYLGLLTDNSECIIHNGNFDQCHTMLNKLHGVLDLQIRDVT